MIIFIVCSRLCVGGAERVGVVLANGFAAHGHEVYLASNTHLDISYPINDVVNLINIFPQTTNKLKKWIRAVARLREEIKRHHPDVIIGIEETCSLMAKIASAGQNTHVICSEHNSFERPLSAPMGRMERLMKYQMTKLYECVTVLTESDRDYIGTRLKNVVVMPNPLSLQPAETVPEKKKVLLAAGRLDVWHYKGFDNLIKSFGLIMKNEELRIKDSGWRLQIAGTGSEESLAYLKQLCKENGVEDSVDFLGFRTDIEELYKQSEIFVLSSRYEGFGLVLIEAMSQGCACVACDYKGRQREIICPNGENESFKFQKCQDSKELEPGTTETCNLKPVTTPLHGVEVCENGILCEVESVEALAEGIKRMMEDEEYRKEVQKNSVERSKAYSINQIVQRWENLFDQIIY